MKVGRCAARRIPRARHAEGGSGAGRRSSSSEDSASVVRVLSSQEPVSAATARIARMPPTIAVPIKAPSRSRGPLAPAEALDRAPEGGQDLRRQRAPAKGGGAGRLPAEGSTHDGGTAPGPLGILRRHGEAEPDLEPPGILEDQAGEASRQRRTQPR